jgi:hypothetical protein
MDQPQPSHVPTQGLAPFVALLWTNWKPVGITYALYNVENLLHLVQPFVLGLAINGLLAGRYEGLALLVGQHLCWLGIGTARKLYDTRTFTAIYTKLATTLVCDQRQAGVSVSVVAARSSLSRELVEFLEHGLKEVFVTFYRGGGAVLMLAVYDPMLAGGALVTLLPLVVLNQRLAQRSYQLNNQLNDQLENEVGVIGTAQLQQVADHYQVLARWRVRLSDLEAWNFFQMEFFILALIVLALVRYCSLPGVAAGDIYAVLAYVVLLIDGLDAVPQVVQKLARLRDIGDRLAANSADKHDSTPCA